jgi:hypothetical protein
MKVFISWSGPRSRVVAEALGYWLPKVLQAVQTFVSTNSIDKGTRWRSVVTNELEQSGFGIVCLTPENLTAPWILFEAGALSKHQKDNVCTVLYDLEPIDFGDPLSQFQATKIDKDDLKELVRVINRVNVNASLTEKDLEETFDVWWPKFEERLLTLPKSQEVNDAKRSERELIEDILTTVRAMQRERDLKEQVSNAFMLQYLHLVRTAIKNDPRLSSSNEIQMSLDELDKRLLLDFAFTRPPKRSYFQELAISLINEKLEVEGQVDKPEDITTNENSDS